MVRRLAARKSVPIAGLVGSLLAGCPNLDQLGPRNAEPFDGGADKLDGATEPKPDAGRKLLPADGDLIGQWDFEGTGNYAEDSSGHDHPAELVGATQEADAGVRGGALVLHGVDSARIPSLEGENFPRRGTMALWLRYSAKSGDFGVLDVFDHARDHVFVRHRPGDVETLQAAFQTPAAPDDYVWEDAFPAPATTWVHIAVAWDEAAQRAELWVNGSSAHAGSFTSAFAFGEQQVVLGDHLTGAIDEVRVYRIMLSDAQIKTLATPP